MKIRVTGYLTLRGVIGNQRAVEIDAEQITLKDLLQQLSVQFGEEIVPPISDSDAFQGRGRRIVVLVNGRHCSHLPDGMDTELADGDEVALFPPVAGG